ncbi:MAG TPA: DUF4215 domain-containing protein [Kofleriaceae bacterium]|nr:DUF4215 domain-containing protein [Kofleriaceae bacterium]
MRLAVIALLLLASCVQSKSVTCGSLVCSEASVCAPSGDRCVLAIQADACEGRADRDACTYTGVAMGICNGAVCYPIGCGNGLVEPEQGELCDDGNRASFDGCSADCHSTEVCGDGAIDIAIGEQCDAGDANSDAPGAPCRLGCRFAGCGDGIIDPSEECDDGNKLPGDGCRADCAGRWTRLPSGTYMPLRAVWGASPANVFFVGDNGTILHFDGSHVTAMAAPQPPIDYYAVAGSGPTNVIAAGSERIDRFDGTSWSTLHVTTDTVWRDAWASPASGVWLVGNGNATLATQAVFAHVTPQYSGVLAISSAREATKLWSDGTKLYVTTASGAGWIRTGSTWASTGGLSGIRLTGVSSTEIYTYDNLGAGLFNGSTTTPMPNSDEMGPDAHDIGGLAGDVLVVGGLGKVTRFDGTTWSIAPTPSSAILYDVWSASVGQAFIAGHQGTILY